MSTYYSGTWWNKPIEERIREAFQRYQRAKRTLEETRWEYKWQVCNVKTFTEYKDLARAFRDAAAVKYRRALYEYLIAKSEYERLLKMEKEELAELVRRPVNAPGKSSPQATRGPLGGKILTPEERIKVGKEFRHQISEMVGPTLRGRISLDPNDPAIVEMAEKLNNMVREAIVEVQKDPNDKNIIELLIATETIQAGMTEGLDESKRIKSEQAIEAASNAVKELYKESETVFQQSPTFGNLKTRLMLHAAIQFLSGDTTDYFEERLKMAQMKRIKPPGSYTAVPGDSLPSIAKDYYGAPAFWDVLYFHNSGTIGKTPDLLRPGMTLKIP